MKSFFRTGFLVLVWMIAIPIIATILYTAGLWIGMTFFGYHPAGYVG